MEAEKVGAKNLSCTIVFGPNKGTRGKNMSKHLNFFGMLKHDQVHMMNHCHWITIRIAIMNFAYSLQVIPSTGSAVLKSSGRDGSENGGLNMIYLAVMCH
jgi:hypothetical protein